ncbi:MAG: hypothetical protein NTW38_05490 [Candidatus Aminicenantes bacterium]|nr:hypothetical protein [Candidatus Aminicenantes bacterium]
MKRPFPGKCLIGLALIFVAGLPVRAQFDPGQYTDEAPFRTWNSFPYVGAAALGRGQTAFAWGTDATVSPANPALLVTLPKWTFTLGGSFQYATAMKFGPVNSGVLTTDLPVGGNLFSGDHAALSFHSGRFAVAAAVFNSEYYDRPATEAYEDYAQIRLYTIRFEQAGFLRTFHLAASLRLSSRLGIGLGLNVDSGRLKTEFLEDENAWGYKFTSTKSVTLRGFSVNGGAYLEIFPSIRAALTFRTPSALEAKTATVDRYEAPLLGTDISIRGESADSFERPLVVGAGLTVKHNERLRTAVDISWLRWSSYQAVWLGESQTRAFRDVVRVSAGGEYEAEFRLFGRKAASPFRFGFVYDPQPTTNPRSAYLSVAFGIGLEIGPFRLDLGALTGSAADSGNRLTALRVSLSCGYVF